MAGYIALVHKDEGTSYGVSFPDVPGCVSAGDTLDEALENAAEALAGHLALMRADGESQPEARGLKAIRADPQHTEDLEGALVREVAPDFGAEMKVIRKARSPARVREARGTGTHGGRFWNNPGTREPKMAKETSTKAAKSASKVLRDDRTGKHSKTAAGSALSQKEKGGGKKKK